MASLDGCDPEDGCILQMEALVLARWSMRMPAMLQLCLQKRLTHEINCNETSRCPIFSLYMMVRQC